MRKNTVLKGLSMMLGCAAIIWATASIKAGNTLPSNSANLRVTTGNTFALVPTDNPYVFGHPVDGVAQVSLMGNCHFHGDGTIYMPTTAGEPIRIVSEIPWKLTSSDGANTLEFDAEGTATFDPANPLFANLTYSVKFVGGTGAFAGATGTGTMEVTAEFTSQLGGVATWTMKGVVITPPSGNPAK